MIALLLGCGEIGEGTFNDLYKYGRHDEIIGGTLTPEKSAAIVNNLKGKHTR